MKSPTSSLCVQRSSSNAELRGVSCRAWCLHLVSQCGVSCTADKRVRSKLSAFILVRAARRELRSLASIEVAEAA